MSNNLPLGWASLTLGDLSVQATERILPSEVDGLPYIGLEHIERDTHRLKGQGVSSDTTSLKSVFQVGDVLYGRLRPNLNKVVMATFVGLCSTDILVLRPNKLIDGAYLLQLLSTPEFLEFATSRAQGINLPRLSVHSIMSYNCPIPPIAEQKRILDALEGHMASVRATRRRLEAAGQFAAQVPSRVLAAAANGVLTQRWRVGRDHKMPSQTAEPAGEGGFLPDGTDQLPPGWKASAIGTLGTVKKGRVRSPEHHHGSDMRPYLRVANVFEDHIDTTDVMTMNFTPAEFERFRLRYGDILLNEGQSLDLVGRPAMFRNELDDVCFTNSLIQFRCGGDVDPEFAILVFRYYLHAGVFSRAAKITTNLAHLGAMRFAALPFPVPPIEEQVEIAKVARANLSRVEQLQGRLANAAEMLVRLEVLIRTRALEGQLVPQRETDRPVREALLDPVLPPSLPSQSPTTPRRKSAVMKAITPLTAALGAGSKALTARELFSAAGYPDDASSDLVERFYLELRKEMIDARIGRSQKQDVDMFELLKGDVA